MKKDSKTSDVISIREDNWRSAFQGHAMRTNFCLALSRTMLEMLCAVADQVHWDRSLYFQDYGVSRPNNWIAPEQALIKRGLVVRVVHSARDSKVPLTDMESRDTLQLTPAGAAVVELLRVAGIFIEADAAIIKRARNGK